MTEAPLYEVFSSIQGEATRVGERHLFLRLAGCDLDCAFCDTPASRRVPERARLILPESKEGSDNPVPRDVLAGWIERLDDQAGPHHALVLTGGEPLLFADYLAPLAREWQGTVLLETGGHRPREMESMLDCVDVVMADIKIESTAGFLTEDTVVADFLRLAARRECAVKVVVSAHTERDEVRRVARLVERSAPDAPLILQPVSGLRFDPPRGAHLIDLQRAAMAEHLATRVIPQTHRILNVR
jgi:organic radical activating enzyme